MAEIDEQIVKQIINNGIKEQINKKLVTDFLINELADSQISMLLKLLLTEEKYILYKKNDVVYYKPSKYEWSEYGNKDKLIDLNIMEHDKYLYAKILDSDNYGEDFNPYYYKFNVSILTHDKEGNIIEKEASVQSKDLRIISDSSIIKHVNKLFKSLNIIR